MFLDKIYGNWMGETQKEKLERILEEVGLENLEGKNILDVGSGPGFLSDVLRKSLKSGFVVSCDIDLENLKRTGGLKVLASGDFLPFRKAFDAVFCIDAVHLLDKKRIGKEFAKVLNKSGILVVSAFCNKYTSDGKMKELGDILGRFRIEKRFFAKAESEWDAVVLARLKYDER